MPLLADRPDLPAAARWTALGGFAIEVGGLATAAQLAQATTVPGDLGIATLAQLLLGLVVAMSGASAFVVPWTQAQRLVGGVAACVSLIVGGLELSWGGTFSLVALLGALAAAVATWPWAGTIGPTGPWGLRRG